MLEGAVVMVEAVVGGGGGAIPRVSHNSIVGVVLRTTMEAPLPLHKEHEYQN